MLITWRTITKLTILSWLCVIMASWTLTAVLAVTHHRSFTDTAVFSGIHVHINHAHDALLFIAGSVCEMRVVRAGSAISGGSRDVP